MPEESLRPGTSRSNTGRAAIEEPWTNRIVPAVCGLSATRLFQSASLTSAPLFVQCSSPVTGAAVSTEVISFDPVIISIAFRRVEQPVLFFEETRGLQRFAVACVLDPNDVGEFGGSVADRLDAKLG